MRTAFRARKVVVVLHPVRIVDERIVNPHGLDGRVVMQNPSDTQGDVERVSLDRDLGQMLEEANEHVFL